MNAAIQMQIVMETGVQNWMVWIKMEIIMLDLDCSFVVNMVSMTSSRFCFVLFGCQAQAKP